MHRRIPPNPPQQERAIPPPDESLGHPGAGLVREQENWWASGDTPVRKDSRVTYLVDGRTAMFTMCLHFLKARKYIYMANWGMSPTLELVRGTDHRAGPDGSPEQELLLERLHAEGLDEDAINFWVTHDLTVQAVLGYALNKGVEVKVLLWDCLEIPGETHYSPSTANAQLTQIGATCILDDSSRGLLHHPAESLHQKITVVDGTHAFVGGIDPLVELTGDFDRWDSPAHPFFSPLRGSKKDSDPHPWHDVHSIIEGPAAGDVELNFRQRWNDVVERHHKSNDLLVPEHPLGPPLEEHTSSVQVARTIPQHTYSFDPDPGIQGIAQLYTNALANVQHFVYLENQYFWLHAYTGIDIPFAGRDSPDMEHIIRELAGALRRGAFMALVLPDHPNVGRAFSDAGIARLREEASEAIAEGRLQVFCLGTSISKEEGEHYRPIYVHAKVAVVDDLWATAGSANLNNRGMRDDTEMNVATLDKRLAEGLRLMLWAEHLGMLSEEELFAVADYLGYQNQREEDREHAKRLWENLQEKLGDPLVGLRLMTERAQENLRRYKARQPLLGYLLPYLTAEEARQQGLPFREAHGWIEEQGRDD